MAKADKHKLSTVLRVSIARFCETRFCIRGYASRAMRLCFLKARAYATDGLCMMTGAKHAHASIIDAHGKPCAMACAGGVGG